MIGNPYATVTEIRSRKDSKQYTGMREFVQIIQLLIFYPWYVNMTGRWKAILYTRNKAIAVQIFANLLTQNNLTIVKDEAWIRR